MSKRWSEGEERKLRKLYDSKTVGEIAEILGRTKGSVNSKIYTMGLSGTKDPKKKHKKKEKKPSKELDLKPVQKSSTSDKETNDIGRMSAGQRKKYFEKLGIAIKSIEENSSTNREVPIIEEDNSGTLWEEKKAEAKESGISG